MADTGELQVHVDVAAGADAEELDALTRNLRANLLELDVESVERARQGEPPAGARAAEVIALGTLLVTLARNARTLGDVVGSLRRWVSADRERRVRLEIGGDVLEVSGVSSNDQERLIAAWIERHVDRTT